MVTQPVGTHVGARKNNVMQDQWHSLSPEVINAILDRTNPYTVVQLRTVSTYLASCALGWIARRRASLRASLRLADVTATWQLADAIHFDNLLSVEEALFTKHVAPDRPMYNRLDLKEKAQVAPMHADFPGCAWTPIEYAVIAGAHRSLEFLFRVGARYPFDLEILLGYAIEQCTKIVPIFDAYHTCAFGMPHYNYPLIEIVGTLLRYMKRTRGVSPCQRNPLTVLRTHLTVIGGLSMSHSRALDVDTLERVPWLALASMLVDAGGYSPDEACAQGKTTERAQLRNLLEGRSIALHPHNAKALHGAFTMLMHLYNRRTDPVIAPILSSGGTLDSAAL